MELGIRSISETSHPMLVMVLIGLGVFMAAGLVVYVVDEFIQDVDAAKHKFKIKSNARRACATCESGNPLK